MCSSFLVLTPVPVKFYVLFLLLHFPSPGWVKINIDGAAVIQVLPLVKVFSVGVGEFIGAFSAFLNVQTALVAEFYGVIYALEEAQKLVLTNV